MIQTGRINAEFMVFDDSTKDKVFNFVTCTRSATFSEYDTPTLTIRTPNGDQTAEFGDIIMKVGTGLFYIIPRAERTNVFFNV